MSRLGKTAAVTMLLALGACGESDGASSESVRSVGQAVLDGRPSDSSENLTVYVLLSSGPFRLRCTGSLVAPNIVMTARHCVLTHRSDTLNCTSDGKLKDTTDPLNNDLTTEDPAHVTIHYGATSAEFTTVGVTRIASPPETSVCRNDVALLVLERPLVEHYAAMRVDAVSPREHFSFSGWGYTDDGQTEIPDQRFTLDDLVVKEVGPGLIPADQFATSGNTLCKGDSGGGAWFGGAVAGVYSRIEGGPAGKCRTPEGRNVFIMLASQRAFIERTFAAEGATPWYAGQPAPWLVKDGAACTSSEQCQSGLCTNSICASPTSPEPAAATDPAEKPGKSPGCTVARTARSDGSVATIIAGICVAYVVRRRKLSRRLHTSLARTVGRVLRSSPGA